MSLFRFDASIHAMSTNSYVDDNMTFDRVSVLTITCSWMICE